MTDQQRLGCTMKRQRLPEGPCHNSGLGLEVEANIKSRKWEFRGRPSQGPGAEEEEITNSTGCPWSSIKSPWPGPGAEEEEITNSTGCPWSSIKSPWPAPPTTAQPRRPAHDPLCATVTVKVLNGYKANSQMLEEVKFRLSCKVCYEPFSAVLGFGHLDNGALMGTPTMHSAGANPMMPVVLSCGHVFCCNCVSQAEQCPCCRATIVGKHKVFFP
jgi:hypothetical protein